MHVCVKLIDIQWCTMVKRPHSEFLYKPMQTKTPIVSVELNYFQGTHKWCGSRISDTDAHPRTRTVWHADLLSESVVHSSRRSNYVKYKPSDIQHCFNSSNKSGSPWNNSTPSLMEPVRAFVHARRLNGSRVSAERIHVFCPSRVPATLERVKPPL